MVEAQAVFATRRGGPAVLTARPITIPQPGAGEVVVRVRAAGVAIGDTLLRRGLRGVRLPVVPGYDAAGTVHALGSGVTGLDVGMPVAVWAGIGAYTTHLRVPAWAVVPHSPSVSSETVAAMLLNYLTAYQMLHRATRLEAGAPVLIHPAAGQVGQALLQLGALRGLRMFGTANSSKLHMVAASGAEPIDYRNDDYTRRLVGQLDAAFDGVGGNSWRTSLKLLKPGGNLVTYGVSGGMRNLPSIARSVIRTPRTSYLTLLQRSIAVTGYTIPETIAAHTGWYREDLTSLLNLLQQGKISPAIGRTYPLGQAAQAHQDIESGRATGKLLLLPPPDVRS